MKRKIVKIEVPELKSARRLTMMELNKYKTDMRHTVITPELLKKMASS